MKADRGAMSRSFLFALVLLLATAAPAWAGDTYWQGTTGDWFDPANWTAGVPTSSDRAYIDNGGTTAIPTGTAQAYRLYAGYAGTGTVAQTGGTNTVSFLHADDHGTYELSGAGTLLAWYEYLGYHSTGTFHQTGGTNTVSWALYLGERPVSTGKYELSGTGTLSAKSEYVGQYGTGIFTQTGGANTVSNCLYLGHQSGSTGTYELGGTGMLSAVSEYVGYSGAGSFIQTGGSNSTEHLEIRPAGQYTIAGGVLQVAHGAVVTGTMDFAGGDASVVMGGLGDLGQARLLGTASASFSIGAHSVAIFPAGFDPHTEFGTFTNDGSYGNAGSTLVIAAGRNFIGHGTFHDRVQCSGTVRESGAGAPWGPIGFAGGLDVVGTGDVEVQTLWVDATSSSISGGKLAARNEYVGQSGVGSFTQTGGTNTIREGGGALYLGYNSGSTGTYQLSGTGTVSATSCEYVGYHGAGSFHQTGGTNAVSYYLYLGHKSGSTGTYELTDTGTLSADRLYVGDWGTGTFHQTGGTNTISGGLHLGHNSGSTGRYELSGTGTLSAGSEFVGGEGTGSFIQTGGTNTMSGNLYLSCNSGCTGTYELSGTGLLSADRLHVGDWGTGTFRQMGGTNAIRDDVYLGYASGSMGTYELSGTGTVSAKSEVLGYYGMGSFIQTGGTNTLNWGLYLGHQSGSVGTYTISGGTLNAERVHIGYDGAGTLAITGAAAQISVSNFLRFGTDSTFTSVPGGTIHMTGAALENLNTDPADLAGLGNLTLIFEGGAAVTDDFEAAGQDKGADLAGWTNNFALSTLQLAGSAAGRIRLVDTFDNRPGWVGDEAVYTGTLVMNAGATIDPGGLNLYYLNGGAAKQFFRGDAKLDGNVDVIDLAALGNNFESTGATWATADFNGDGLVDVLDLAILANNFGSETGGLVGTPVPEPATFSLLVLGAMSLLRRKRERLH